jgi:uncharacterized membrane protein
LFESVLAVVQAFFSTLLSTLSGLFTFIWGLLETIGGFIGASAQFVYGTSSTGSGIATRTDVKANFIVIGIIILVFVCYQDRKARGAKADRKSKKRI